VISALFPFAAIAVLAALAFRNLRASDYSLRDCVILVALMIVQLAAAFSARPFHALLLALALCVTAKAAMEFAAAQSARGVIALGLSLAATQVVSPAGVVVSALVVPALAAAQAPTSSRGKNTGLLLLLLFTPLASAAAFACMARELQFDPWIYMMGPFDHFLHPRIFDPASLRRSGLINAVAMAAVAFPIWWTASRSRRAGWVAIVASALMVAVAVAALMQRSYSFGAFVPSLAGLSMLAIAELESGSHRARQAIAMSAASAAISWLLLAASL